ncbi:MAG: SDR family NAD(P)-dependent oxidoreductase [Bacilli bacterium]|nr:SDR family NAD(P)-dependent oxidoreductase [Bacilli bacterium]
MKAKKWLDAHMESFMGRKVLITGATSGIGLEAAISFAYLGAEVYIACRNKKKAEATLPLILKEVPSAKINFLFYEQNNADLIWILKKSIEEIDFYAVVLNAGVYFPKQEKNEPSLTISTNLEGTYKVYTALKEDHPNSKFIFINSIANKSPKNHDYSLYIGKSDPISRNDSYAVSKRGVMNIFMHELKEGKMDVRMTHPGISKTNIIQSYAPFIKKIGNGFLYLFTHHPWKAALEIVFASSDRNKNGSYVVPRGPFHISGYPKIAHLNKKKSSLDMEDLYSNLER